jgi:hypothetical protein
MIRDRLIAIWNYHGLSAKELESQSGIDREKWYSLRNERRRANEDDIEAIAKIFPKYALWIVTGEVAPEAGQTSPDYDEAHDALKQHGGG